jgi:hypothetical protein
MSRTTIPDHLIHRPEEVECNAQRFDQLCRLAEEVALPVVREALIRETTATGAEALTSEAKLALQGLVDDAVLEDLDGPGVLDEVRRSLECAIPPPSEQECQALTRDVAQVLMSTWLEMLRSHLSRVSLLVLSDQLLPLVFLNYAKRLVSRLVTKAPQPLSDALGSLALNEREADHIMKTLRIKLFSEPRLVELPFELVVVGAPDRPVFAMRRSTYDSLLENFVPAMADRPEKEVDPAASERKAPDFVTPLARAAAANLSAYLPQDHYTYLSQQAGRASVYLYRVAGRS